MRDGPAVTGVWEKADYQSAAGCHTSPQSDSELIRRIKDCETEALALLYGRYSKALYAVFVCIMRDEKAAEDLTQEFFLRLASRITRFDEEKGSLDLWMRTVARNMAIDQMRSGAAKFNKKCVQPEHLDQISVGNSAHLTTHQQVLVSQAMVLLNPARRQLIELVYFHGYSQTEIASLLHKPLGTVKSNIRLALVELALAFNTKSHAHGATC